MSRNYMIAMKKSNAKQSEGWRKPMEAKLMINVDAAFDVDSGREAIGVVIRDYTGQCIVQQLNDFFRMLLKNLYMAEAYDFREGASVVTTD
jgi:hypothetical protein